jgi:hypothetical protein
MSGDSSSWCDDDRPLTEIIVVQTTFPIGMLAATPGAIEVIDNAGQSPGEFLARHCARDWGELDDEDRRANDLAADSFERILSAYTTNDGSAIWIITEADRSATVLLLPDEY